MPTTTPDDPADTRMMGVVHSALRRDLVRLLIVIRSEPQPDDARRVAVADHLLWMMDFLHHHHRGEDDGLYPLVVSKNADAEPLVREMDAEHAAVAPAISSVEAAARAYRDSSDARPSVLEALDTLREVLLPHLEREEVEMMPVVSASISAAEWSAWDQATNVKPKGLRQLGMEGHWLIDGEPGSWDSCRRCPVSSCCTALPRPTAAAPPGCGAALGRPTYRRWVSTCLRSGHRDLTSRVR